MRPTTSSSQRVPQAWHEDAMDDDDRMACVPLADLAIELGNLSYVLTWRRTAGRDNYRRSQLRNNTGFMRASRCAPTFKSSHAFSAARQTCHNPWLTPPWMTIANLPSPGRSIGGCAISAPAPAAASTAARSAARFHASVRALPRNHRPQGLPCVRCRVPQPVCRTLRRRFCRRLHRRRRHRPSRSLGSELAFRQS